MNDERWENERMDRVADGARKRTQRRAMFALCIHVGLRSLNDFVGERK